LVLGAGVGVFDFFVAELHGLSVPGHETEDVLDKGVVGVRLGALEDCILVEGFPYERGVRAVDEAFDLEV